MSELSVQPGRARPTARLSVAARQALGTQLRALSQGRISRRAVAAATGLGIGTVMDLWAGRSDPELSTLLALVEVLGVRSIDELLGPLGTQVLLEHQRTGTRRTA